MSVAVLSAQNRTIFEIVKVKTLWSIQPGVGGRKRNKKIILLLVQLYILLEARDGVFREERCEY